MNIVCHVALLRVNDVVFMDENHVVFEGMPGM